MVDGERLLARALEQAEKKWDTDSIRAWLDAVARDGIAAWGISPQEAIQRKREVLDRVQQRAEECTFLGHV
jgi:hypothetical protein